MFNALFTKTDEYAKLAQALGGPGACALFGIPGSGRAMVYAALAKALDKPLCIVTPGEAEATRFAGDLNALGVAAVLVLVGALVGPLLRTLAVVFMLRLSAALLEPIADGDIVCAIGDFSRTVVLFFITMLCVGTMYFLLIVQVLLVGNLTVLLR